MSRYSGARGLNKLQIADMIDELTLAILRMNDDEYNEICDLAGDDFMYLADTLDTISQSIRDSSY